MLLSSEVFFAGKLSTQETARLVEDFQTVGLAANLQEVSPRRSLDDIAWLILAAIPLKPFFDQLAKESAADAYRRLNSFVHRIFHGRQPQLTESPKVLLLQDSTRGIQIVLESDLPAESYQQLLSFDLATIRLGPLHYDRHRHEWRSELDEAAGTTAPKLTNKPASTDP